MFTLCPIAHCIAITSIHTPSATYIGWFKNAWASEAIISILFFLGIPGNLTGQTWLKKIHPPTEAGKYFITPDQMTIDHTVLFLRCKQINIFEAGG